MKSSFYNETDWQLEEIKKLKKKLKLEFDVGYKLGVKEGRAQLKEVHEIIEKLQKAAHATAKAIKELT